MYFQLPAHHTTDFALLFHLASYRAALRILDTTSIYGQDVGKHANFSVIREKPSLARDAEVLLVFVTGAAQVATWYPLVGETEPTPQVMGLPAAPGTAYHVFTGSPPAVVSNANLLLSNYWHTLVYPSAHGLRLVSATLCPPAPTIPALRGIDRVLVRQSAMDQIDHARLYTSRCRGLDEAFQRARAKPFLVVDPPPRI